MRKRQSLELGVSACLTLAILSLVSWASVDAAETAKMATFSKASGEKFFALSMSLDKSVAKQTPTEVIVLVDTSASQTGLFREDSLATVKAMLKTFSADTKVKIMAGDLHSVSMSQTFDAPQSAAVAEGLANLEKRTPLGATDLSAILLESVEKFESSANAARTIVYIGDGTSRANFLSLEESQELVSSLRKARVSVVSFAIGPERDIEALAALANHTGGQLFVDNNSISSEEAGAEISAAATTTVVWPQKATFSNNIKESFPSDVPPLRTDRDSILIGSLKGTSDTASVKVMGLVAGKSVELKWSTTPEASSDDHAYLPQMVKIARKDNGIGLPTVGSAGLRESARMLTEAANTFSKLSGQALASGDMNAASKLAQAALSRDPGHPQALAVMKLVEKGETVEAAEPQSAQTEQPVKKATSGILKLNEGASYRRPSNKKSPFQFVARQVAAADAAPAAEGTFLDDVDQRRKIQAQIVKSEVQQTLANARDRMGVDPNGVKDGLKLLLNSIDRTPDLDAEMRTDLRNKIVAAIKEASRRSVQVENERQRDGENQAINEERRRLTEALLRDEERVRSIMEMFNALMAEDKYKAAEESAVEARSIDPLNTATHVAIANAEFGGNHYDIQAIREERYHGFIDTMWLTEQSHVPFPDEPPIVYPDREFWEDITRRRKKYSSVDLAQTGSAEQKIFTALEEPTKIQFIDTPLNEVIDYLKQLHGIEIQIDQKALDDVGLSTDTPITRNIEGISLRSALRLMLKELDLTYVVANEVLSVTTPEEAEAELVTKVYPVADLVMPITAGVGGAGLGGGQLGGNFQGQGGGGQGGQGGGFGGGGGGGGLFAVEDEKAVLKLGDSTEKAEVTEVKPAKKAAFILEVKDGETRLQAWQRVMNSDVTIPAQAVRSEVRRSMNTKKYDDVVALIQMALRLGHPQPWMYEAMGLAMQLNHSPTEEIERALMSAVDFTSGPEHMMFVGTYMSRIGLDQRALKIFQDVAHLEPLRPEPYVFGLAAAKRMESIEGIQWACLGALKQAWPNDSVSVKAEAFRTASATLETLIKEKKLDAAKEFQAKLNKALARDCIVKVSWTGDADLDISVEEPSGTVCSLHNQRTVSGGVMLGDTTSSLQGVGADGLSEVYVCPEGFSGNYRLFIKRVWGEITAGKVTVDVYTNYGSEDQKHLRKQMDLGKTASVVTFNLKDGRRTEDLEEHQVQVAAKAHVDLGRAIVAQQLNSSYDDNYLEESYVADRNTNNDDIARRNRSSVGFRPVTTTLPEGTNFSAFAVISADRRYVRFSGTPLFSGVGDVTTFNFATGDVGNNEPDDGDGGAVPAPNN